MNTLDNLEKLNSMVFSFISITQHNSYTGWKRKESRFNKYSIIFVTKGRGSLHIDKRVYHLETNKCFLLVPNMDLYFDTDPYNPLQYYEIDFDYTQLNEKQNENDIFPFQGEIPIQNSLEVLNIVSELHKKEHQLIHLEQLRKNAIFHQLMYIVANQICNEYSSFNIKTAIELTKKYMINHYDHEITREALAYMVGYSADYFSRLFKKEVGVSPNEYLIQIRIKRAKEYLVTSNQRLKEIAKSVGYSDQFYFSRLFKKVAGVSPVVYVKKNRKKVATVYARDVEALMTLGITPIAATRYLEGEFDTIAEFNKSLKDAGVIDLGDQGTPNLETLREAEPDLIIFTKWHEIYEDVSKIAPTVMLDTSGWDRFEELASILGKEAEAEVFKEHYEKKYTEAKNVLKEHVKENESVLFLAVYNQKWGMAITGVDFIFNQLLYDKLGLNPPPAAIHPNEQVFISVEGLVEMNPDYMFVTIMEQNYYDEIFSYEVIQHINAFKNDRVFVIDDSFVRNIKGVSLAIDFITESITGDKK